MYSGNLPIGHDCYAWYYNKIILIIHLISMFGLLLNLLLTRMLHSNFIDEVKPRPVNMQRNNNIITGTWRPASRKLNNILPNISQKITTFCRNLSPGPTSVSCVATFPLHTSALCRLWSVERVLLQECVTKSGTGLQTGEVPADLRTGHLTHPFVYRHSSAIQISHTF